MASILTEESKPTFSSSGNLRVCHVSLTLCTGGLERLLVDFARYHNDDKFDLQYLAMQETGRFADELKGLNYTVSLLKTSGKFEQIREMANLFKEQKIDVVHTHNTYPHIYASLAARWAGVPVVINTRHGQRHGHGWKSRFKYRLASFAVDRIVAVSEDAARLTRDDDHVSPHRITKIWNGIDVEDFEFHGPVLKPIAISVARLSAEKDFPTLLQAVAKVVKAIPDFQLILVGDGAERNKLEKMVEELELQNHVELLGERKDVPDLLKKAGFFVSSSITEGISLTLLEAMSVGLPLLATSVGGTPEIIEDKMNGLLVIPSDPDALANGIIEMIGMMENWNEMGTHGRKRVETHFDIRRMVKDYEQLYQECLEK